MEKHPCRCNKGSRGALSWITQVNLKYNQYNHMYPSKREADLTHTEEKVPYN